MTNYQSNYQLFFISFSDIHFPETIEMTILQVKMHLIRQGLKTGWNVNIRKIICNEKNETKHHIKYSYCIPWFKHILLQTFGRYCGTFTRFTSFKNPQIILFVCRSLEQMEALFSGPLVVLFRKNHETVEWVFLEYKYGILEVNYVDGGHLLE